MIRLAMAIGAATMLANGATQAGERPMMPPSPMVDPAGAKATTARPVAQSVSLGGKTYALDDAVNLSKLAAELGSVAPGHTGDAGDSFSWVCYALPAQQLRLWLAAGEGGKLDMVTVQSSQAAPSASCPVAAGNLAPVTIDGIISVGMTEEQLKARLGPPARSESGWWVYRRSVDMQEGARMDEDDELVVHVDKGRIVYLQAKRTATY